MENLSQLSGKVLSRKPHPRLPDYDVLTVQLDQIDPVEGKTDLLATRLGSPIELSVRRALLGSTSANVRVRCRAKLTPDGAMCEPYPEPGSFEVRPE
jgi:hypothetical protein